MLHALPHAEKPSVLRSTALRLSSAGLLQPGRAAAPRLRFLSWQPGRIGRACRGGRPLVSWRVRCTCIACNQPIACAGKLFEQGKLQAVL